MVNNVLIIGSGAREHALGWKLKQSAKVGKVYFAPGTSATSTIGKSTNISIRVGTVLLVVTAEPHYVHWTG